MDRAVAVALAGLVAGCSSPTPPQKCDQLVATICKKTFQCGGGAAYPSETECETKLEAQIGCAQWSVPAGCSYDWGPFDRCLADVDAESCSDASRGQLPASCQGAAVQPPACPGGAVNCHDTSSDGSNASCTQSWSNCSDGKSYTLSCNAGACTCQTGGATQSAAGVTDCTEDESVVNMACGWNLIVKHHVAADMTMVDMTQACIVAGQPYAAGAPDPQNPCNSCQPAVSMSAFSPTPIAAGLQGGAQGLAVDGTSAYFGNANTLRKVGLDGANDARCVYWTTASEGAMGGAVMKAGK